MSDLTQDWTGRYVGALMNTFGVPQLVLERGQGVRVWDTDGKEYLDFLGGIAVNALGHAHPALVDAVSAQLGQLGHISNFFASRPQIELAERLLALCGASGEGRVFFTNSGTEANEAGFKLSRRTGRTHVVSAYGAFHGRSMGALALTAKAAYREPFEPLPGEVTFVPYGDTAALAGAVTDRTAAVILEPIQGEAGVIVPPGGYLAEARRITRAHGALLWLDEIQTGVGRTGQWFAAANQVGPDVITLAKGLAGGIPIGACIARGAAGELFQPGNHGTTFGGNPVACAAGLAVLDTIEKDGLLDNAREMGERLRAGLGADERVVETRGAGLLIGLSLDGNYAAEVVGAARERGFLVNAPAADRIRLAPPLIIDTAEVDALVGAWPTILTAAEETAKGTATQ